MNNELKNENAIKENKYGYTFAMSASSPYFFFKYIVLDFFKNMFFFQFKNFGTQLLIL